MISLRLRRALGVGFILSMACNMAVAKPCASDFAELDQAMLRQTEAKYPLPTRPTADLAKGFYQIPRGICGGRKDWVTCARDKIRYFFQTRINHRDYPAVAADDYTTLKAYILANDGVSGDMKFLRRKLAENTPPAQPESVEPTFGEPMPTPVTEGPSPLLPGSEMSEAEIIQSIKTEVAELIERSKSFRERAAAAHSRRLTLELQIPALERWIKAENATGGLPQHSIKVPLPYVELKTMEEVTEDGLVNAIPDPIPMMEQLFGTAAQLENNLKSWKKELKSLKGDRLWRGETDELYLEQAVNLKRLETYHHEIVKALGKPGSKLKKDVAKLRKDIESLYYMDGQIAAQFRPEYGPGQQVWDHLKWVQFGVEVKDSFFKYVPSIRDSGLIDRLKEIVGNMSEEEMRMVGLNKVSLQAEYAVNNRFYTNWVNKESYVNFFSRINWKTVGVAGVPAASTVGYGLVAGVDFVWNFLFQNERSRQECVSAKDDSEAYGECTVRHLQTMFPQKFARWLKDSKKYSLTDANGKWTDPEIIREVELIRTKRVKLMADIRSMQSLLLAARTKMLNEPDFPDRDPYILYLAKLDLTKAPDRAKFAQAMIGTDEKGVNSFLAYQHPFLFAKARPEIKAIVELGPKPFGDEDAAAEWEKNMKPHLMEIRALDTELATTIEDIYNKAAEVYNEAHPD